GELNEGSTWEAALSAPHWKLDNLIALEVLGSPDLVAKFEAFGWHAQRVDGNDIEAVIAAFDTARELKDAKPRIIVFDTLMGRGVPFLETREKTHFIRVDEEEWDLAIKAVDDGWAAQGGIVNADI
ncbi:hypothetical protein LTR94_031191, partial [Friedmanniomyces endolithicus]